MARLGFHTALLLLTLSTVEARAATLVIDKFNMGWYQDNGTHDAVNYNTLTGSLIPTLYRSFYLWDIPTLPGNVLSARVDFGTVDTSYPGRSFTAAAFDLSSQSIAQINLSNGGGSGTSIYADLGTGTSYGTFDVHEIAANQVLSFSLNQDAVAAINALSGARFGMGLTLVGATTTSIDYFLFSDTSSPKSAFRIQLVLDVPEPQPPVLVGAIALALLAWLSFGQATRATDG